MRPQEAANVAEATSTGFDEQLICQARSDSDAFSRLYRRHYDSVFRYCMHRLFERAAAEDAVSRPSF